MSENKPIFEQFYLAHKKQHAKSKNNKYFIGFLRIQ